jgi:hypothetical protein
LQRISLSRVDRTRARIQRREMRTSSERSKRPLKAQSKLLLPLRRASKNMQAL